MTEVILPQDSFAYQLFEQLVADADCVFFAGLPGVGKSLMVQQLSLMAQEKGRNVSLLQWDTTRPAFEFDENMAKYPEIDGVTHAMIRKAVGMWARDGVKIWYETHTRPDAMLIGEVPLVGNRLIELVKRYDDAVEPILRDDRTQFVLPVPSLAIRQLIEAKREQTIRNPQHEKESYDAPPNVLEMMWDALYQLAGQLKLVTSTDDRIPYTPEIYQGVYEYLLQYRNIQVLPMNEALQSPDSVYAYLQDIPDIYATQEQAKMIMARLETMMTLEQVETDVAQWYEMG